jgi:hypothetical protein
MTSHLVSVATLIGAALAYWFGFGIVGSVALVIGISLEVWFCTRRLSGRER